MPPILGVDQPGRSTRTNGQAGTGREGIVARDYISHRGLQRLIGDFVTQETLLILFDVHISHALGPTVDGCPNYFHNS